MPSEIPTPMLAKAVTTVPDSDAVAGGYTYEPKWDGFRAIVSYDGTDVVIGSRGAKPLTRYFPELVEAFRVLLPEPCLIDGEIIVPSAGKNSARLSWEHLSQRIHPAQSRVRLLSETTPASFVAFDLLARGDQEVMNQPFAVRREALESLFRDIPAPLYLTRTTEDAEHAREWLERFEGAGLDGVVAKAKNSPYTPGKRTMLKIKHVRTADVVAIGYRIHKSGSGVGSILVGLYDEKGTLRQVGGVSAFTDKRRRELVAELDPLVERDAHGDAVHGSGERSRFTSAKDVSFVSLRPERVLEVRYDQLEGVRFRHTVQFERWRPDRDPRSCTFDQLDVVADYDLRDVLI